MKEWEVPGLAIAIVKDDKVIFAKGYGVRARRHGSGERADGVRDRIVVESFHSRDPRDAG